MKNLILGLLMSSMIFGPMVSVAGNQKHVSGCIVRSSFGIHSMTDGGTHGGTHSGPHETFFMTPVS